MTNQKSAWILTFAIRISLVVFLSVLALGLINGADPVVATVRSVVAFASFLVLGWGASILLVPSEAEKVEVESDTGTVATASAKKADGQTTAPAAATAIPTGAVSAPQK